MMTYEEAIEILEEVKVMDDSMYQYAGEYMEALDVAISAMKAQEPIAPVFDYDGRDVWRCGNCHTNIFHPSHTDADEDSKNYHRFCFHCGRPVKWDE